MTEILKPCPTHHRVTESPSHRGDVFFAFVIWCNLLFGKTVRDFSNIQVWLCQLRGAWEGILRKKSFSNKQLIKRVPFQTFTSFFDNSLSICHCLSSKGIQSVHVHFNFFSNTSTCWSSTFTIFSREVTAISLTEMLFGRLDVVESLRIYFPITGFFFYLFFMVSWRLWIEPMKLFQCGKMVGFDKIAGEHSRSGVLVG